MITYMVRKLTVSVVLQLSKVLTESYRAFACWPWHQVMEKTVPLLDAKVLLLDVHFVSILSPQIHAHAFHDDQPVIVHPQSAGHLISPNDQIEAFSTVKAIKTATQINRPTIPCLIINHVDATVHDSSPSMTRLTILSSIRRCLFWAP